MTSKLQGVALVLRWLLSTALFVVCAGCYEYAFTPGSEEESLDAEVPEFFILRYLAYRGPDCEIGGTLNEVAIRNNAKIEMVVEELDLVMRQGGVVKSNSTAPHAYLDSVIESGRRPASDDSIASEQWKYFAFPAADCSIITHEQPMEYDFSISIRAGQQHYQRHVTISRKATKSPRAWP